MPNPGPARSTGMAVRPRLEARAKRAVTWLLPLSLRRSRPFLALMAIVASASVEHVVELLRLLEAADVPVWLAGGWGVDALVGRRTRRHGDLDLVVDSAHEETALQVLRRAGYRVAWSSVVAEAMFPERTWLADTRGRQIDLHPIAVDAWLAATAPALLPGVADPAAAAFTRGRLGGEAVPCLSRRVQLAAHEGYTRRPVDDRDVALLRSPAT